MNETPTGREPAWGERLSDHPHPRPFLRRLTALLLALGIAGAVAGVVGLVALGVGYGLPLLPLGAIFLAALIVPLVQLTALHPRVTVYEGGLWVKPLLWRGCWVAWDAIDRLETHTLIRRGTTKAGQREFKGELVVVRRGLSWPFASVGFMAGLGWRTRAFGIAAHSHVDYARLRRAIKQGRYRP